MPIEVRFKLRKMRGPYGHEYQGEVEIPPALVRAVDAAGNERVMARRGIRATARGADQLDAVNRAAEVAKRFAGMLPDSVLPTAAVDEARKKLSRGEKIKKGLKKGVKGLFKSGLKAIF